MAIYAISDLHLSFNDDSKSMEFFGPDLPNTIYKVTKMTDAEGNDLEVARHPKQVLKMIVPFTLHYCDMVRLVKKS